MRCTCARGCMNSCGCLWGAFNEAECIFLNDLLDENWVWLWIWIGIYFEIVVDGNVGFGVIWCVFWNFEVKNAVSFGGKCCQFQNCCQNFEKFQKIWKIAKKNWKIVKNFEKLQKFWKIVKILKNCQSFNKIEIWKKKLRKS